MGSITITVVGDASVGTQTKTIKYADADILRLINWSKGLVGPKATISDGVSAWVDKECKDAMELVMRDEKSTAVAAVLLNIKDIKSV